MMRPVGYCSNSRFGSARVDDWKQTAQSLIACSQGRRETTLLEQRREIHTPGPVHFLIRSLMDKTCL